MSKPGDEQMYLLMEAFTLQDGTTLGDASPTALLAELDELRQKLDVMQRFLRFCPEDATSIREGFRLARERADLVDGANMARTNLLEVISEEELRADMDTLNEDQRMTLETRADQLLARWEEGDPHIRSSMLQKRLEQLLSANRMIDQHEAAHGLQVWWENDGRRAF